MRIHIKRQGIVIRSVEIKGDKASVGSGAECDIRVDDPYLAGHVADLVNRGGEWRIIDKATSLEGVTHAGRRVEDEPLVSGEGYAIGAFELVAEGAAAGKAQQVPVASQPLDRSVAPRTMMQDFNAVDSGGNASFPRTMFEAEVPGGIPGSTPNRPAAPASQFQPQAASGGFQPVNIPAQRANAPFAAAGPPRKSRSKLPLLIALFFLVIVVLGMIALMMMGGGGEQTAATSTSATPTPAPAATPASISPADQGNQYAASLEIDKALQSWETAIQAGGNDPLRAKYAKVAYDAAMVYAAANDTPKSKSYLERVVKFGPPDSVEVERAKARIGS